MNTPPQNPEPVPDMLLGLYTSRPADSPAPEPPKPVGFGRKILNIMMGKIGITLLCTAIWQTLTNSPAIVHGLRVACTFIGLMGDEKVAKKVGDIFNEGEKVAHTEVDGSKPSLKDRITGTGGDNGVDQRKPGLLPRISTKAEVITAPIKQAASDAADKAKDTVQKVAEPVKAGVEKAADTAQEGVAAIKKLGQSGGPATNAPPDAATRPMQRTGVGTMVNAFSRGGSPQAGGMADERAEYSEFCAEVLPNGRCPACKAPMRVSRNGKGTIACLSPRCGFRSHADKARAMGAPEPPRIPPAAFYAWKQDRLKKAEEQARKQQPAPTVGPPKPTGPVNHPASVEDAR